MKKSFFYTTAILIFAGIITLGSCDKHPEPTPETPLEEYDASRIQFVKLNPDSTETQDTVTVNFDRSGTPDPAVASLDRHTVYHMYITMLKNGQSVNQEIIDEGTIHRFFFLPGKSGIIDYSYRDADENGIGIGLQGTLSLIDTGQVNLKVVLRHGLDKASPAAASWHSDNYEAAGGEDDLNISFSILSN